MTTNKGTKDMTNDEELRLLHQIEQLREALTYIAKPLTRYDTAGDMQLIARTALERHPKP